MTVRDRGVARVPGLDAIRAFSALLIVFFHATIFSGPSKLDGGGLQDFATGGYLAVDVFFVLSGVVLFLPAVEKGTIGPLKDYVAHRALRILPMYWLILAAAMVFRVNPPEGKAILPPSAAGWRELAAHLTFLQTPIYGLDFRRNGEGFDGVLWTLSIEVMFYVVFPFLVRPMLRRPWAVLIGALALSRAWVWYAEHEVHGATDQQHMIVQLPTYAFHFVAGMGIAMALVHLRDTGRGPRLARSAGVLFFGGSLGTAAFLIAAGTHPGPNTPQLDTVDASPALVAAVAVMIFGAVAIRGRVGTVLAAGWIFAVSDATYALYVLHLPIMSAIQRNTDKHPTGSLGDLGIMLGSGALALVLALVLARWFERPLRRAVLARLQRPRTRPPEGPVVVDEAPVAVVVPSAAALVTAASFVPRAQQTSVVVPDVVEPEPEVELLQLPPVIDGTIYKGRRRTRPWVKRGLIGSIALVAFTWLPLQRGRGQSPTHVIWAEDGGIYLSQWINHGIASLFTPYNGYLHITPRLLTWPAAALPLKDAALALSYTAAGVTALLGLVVFWASGAVLRSRGLRGLVAIALPLLPQTTYETTAALTDLHWALLVTLGWVLLAAPTKRWGRALAIFLTIVTTFSDPLAFVLLPLAVVGVRRSTERRRAMVAPLVMLPCLAVQEAVHLATGFMHAGPTQLHDVPTIYALRVLLSGIMGDAWLTDWSTMSPVLVAAALVWLMTLLILARKASAIRRWTAAILVLGSIAMTCLPLVLRGTVGFLVHPVNLNGSRYTVPGIQLLLAALVVLVDAAGPRLRAPAFVAIAIGLLLQWGAIADISTARTLGPDWHQTLQAASARCADPERSPDKAPILGGRSGGNDVSPHVGADDVVLPIDPAPVGYPLLFGVVISCERLARG